MPDITAITAELHAAGIDADRVITDRTAMTCYGYDATRQSRPPLLVVLPQSTVEVAAALKTAAAHRLPVFTRGAGSGMSGGTIPTGAGMVLSLTMMTRVLELDLENFMVTVEPGIITKELQEAVAAHGLWYPPDPASLAFSTLGGNVAENAGGPCAVKYGVTGEYVRGLEVVLADGTVITTGNKCVKSVSGYDLTRLFVGSEGTLGVITKILLRLLPPPAARRTQLLAFADMGTAAETITAMFRRRLVPATIEFLDHHSIAAIRQELPFALPPAARALLLVEIDGEPETVDRDAERLRELVAPTAIAVITAADERERDTLWQARRALSPAIARIAPHKLNEDIAVPRASIPAIIARIDAIAAEVELPIVCFGHAGDGNIHVNVMLDKTDPGQAERGERAVAEIFRATVGLGGTLSGEHGIGNTKSAFLPLEWDAPTIATMRAVKLALDPENRLNPGKIFPPDFHDHIS
ncbi:MAG: FAD-binding protein [Deltaproteobacteria bacterium]|nr:FAD-binding protein [Candidatus Anaeroferrophillacea bacterium]